MKMFRALVTAASAFGMTAMSLDVAGETNSRSTRHITLVDRLAADGPTAGAAIITPVSAERAKNLGDATLSTSIVDCPPGASAMLHRMPSSGYVLVHVLSGTIRASAWHAGVGTYHTGETWVEPAFAYSITIANSSDQQSAQALVVLVTGDSGMQTRRPTLTE